MTSGLHRDAIRDQSEDVTLIGQSSQVLNEALYHPISMRADDTFTRSGHRDAYTLQTARFKSIYSDGQVSRAGERVH